MESQLQRPHGYHGEEQAMQGGDVGHNHEKKSVLKNVKDKVKRKTKKIKETLTKQGNSPEKDNDHQSHDEDDEYDDEEVVEDPEVHGAPMYDAAAVRSGVGAGHQPGVNLEKPTEKAEDRYNPITDASTRPFSQLEHDKPRQEQFGNVEHERVENKENTGIKFGIPTEMDEDLNTSKGRQEASNYGSKITNPTGTGGAETGITPILRSFDAPKHEHADPTNAGAGINPILRSFDKMSVYDEPRPEDPTKMFPGSHDQFSPEPIPESTPLEPKESPHKMFTGSHDQFSTEPIPEDMHVDSRDPGSPLKALASQEQQGGYTGKISSVTSALSGKALAAKDMVGSKLGYGQKEGSGVSDIGVGEKEGYGVSKTGVGEQKGGYISSATSALTGTAAAAKNIVASKLGYGDKEASGVSKTGAVENQGYGESNTGVGEKESYGISNTGVGEKKFNDGVSNTGVGEQKGGYISSATSALTGTAAAAKNIVASKLGYGEKQGSEVSHTGTGEKLGSGVSNTGSGEQEGYGVSNTGVGEQKGGYTSALTDKAVAAKNIVTSKLGYGEKEESGVSNTAGFEKEVSKTGGGEKSGGVTATVADYATRAAATVTGTLAPVTEKVTNVGSSVLGKVQGSSTGQIGENKGQGGSFNLAEKLRPSEEDKALSDVISETLYRKKPEAEQKPMGKVTVSDKLTKELGTKGEDPKVDNEGIDERVGGKASPAVVDRVKGWFGMAQSQDSQGNINDGNNQVSSPISVGEERKLHETTN